MIWHPITPSSPAPTDRLILLYRKEARYKIVTARWDKGWKAWMSEPGKWTMTRPTHWAEIPGEPE